MAVTDLGAIYSGVIRHRRFLPRQHIFSYRIRMLYLNLTESDCLLKPFPILHCRYPSLGWLRRKDYIGEQKKSLQSEILDQVENKLGFRPTGNIYLLTHLRYWGLMMNPISIFYCHSQDNQLCAIAMQVTNTPWKEKILYMLDTRESAGKPYKIFDKLMHVSPFNPMEMQYHCRFNTPNDRLFFHLENHTEDIIHTDATLILDRNPLTRSRLIKIVLIQPTETLKVFTGIYWNALRLWFKGTPIYDHPKKLSK